MQRSHYKLIRNYNQELIAKSQEERYLVTSMQDDVMVRYIQIQAYIFSERSLAFINKGGKHFERSNTHHMHSPC